MGHDFSLYSTYDDAVNNVNRWKYCNYDFNGTGIRFPQERVLNMIQKILIKCWSDQPIVKGLPVSLQDDSNNDLRHFKIRGYCQKNEEPIGLSKYCTRSVSRPL